MWKVFKEVMRHNVFIFTAFRGKEDANENSCNRGVMKLKLRSHT